MLITKNFIFCTTLGIILSTLSLKVNANEPTNVAQTLPTQETNVIEGSIFYMFNRAFFHNTGRFFELTDLSGQANSIFGWRTFPGSFVDNMITWDGLVLNTLYTDVMRQQTAGPRIRTQDLPSPFDTSIQENPNYLSPVGP